MIPFPNSSLEITDCVYKDFLNLFPNLFSFHYERFNKINNFFQNMRYISSY